jgi:hypothetical protein
LGGGESEIPIKSPAVIRMKMRSSPVCRYRVWGGITHDIAAPNINSVIHARKRARFTHQLVCLMASSLLQPTPDLLTVLFVNLPMTLQ